MNILTLDFETYWTKPSDGYTLSKMSAAEYVTDERFRAHGCAVKLNDRPAKWVTHDALPALFGKVPWNDVVVLGHNVAGFDSLILEWVYRVRPRGYVDTMSMARAVLGVRSDGFSLDGVSEALGLRGKQFRDNFARTQGHRILPPEVEESLIPYALNDADETYRIFRMLKPHIPAREWVLIDWCVKCACRPALTLDVGLLWKAHDEEVARKRAVIEAIGGDEFKAARDELIGAAKRSPLDAFEAGKKVLGSNHKLAALLEPLLHEWEIDMPMKPSRGKTTQGELTYAFSASDEEFVVLQEHPDERIAQIVEARLAVKGSIVETRSRSLAKVGEATGWWPVGLNYSGAVATQRYSGNSVAGGNAQNLKRGSKMREAVIAPEGHVIIAGDLSQIELRISAYMACVSEILQMLIDGGDLYSHFAGYVYERLIDKKKDPDERQVGKVAVLSLGYGAGAAAFARMLLVQAKMRVSPEFAERVVRIYRELYPGYVAAWKTCRLCLAAWAKGQTPGSMVELPPAYRWGDEVGAVTLPSGLKLKYYDITQRKIYDKMRGEWNFAYIYPSYERKKAFWLKDENGGIIDESTRYQKITGNTLFENFGQSGAREVMSDIQMRVLRRAPWLRQAVQVHDELVCVAPDARVREGVMILGEEMNRAPSFWPDLPVAAEVGVDRSYGLLKKISWKDAQEKWG
jgi:hypothetical protein